MNVRHGQRRREEAIGQNGVSGNDRTGPQPQPEHHEPRLADPTPGKLTARDYAAILKRSLKEVRDDNQIGRASCRERV